MAHDVFISYSSTDQQAAQAVLHGLESDGIRCWMAPRDIRPGAIWAQAIMDAIASARALVVVFSANANRSSHVLTEVDAAVRKGVVIVPFRIEDVMPDGAMEYHLRSRHWLDALTPDLEDHVTRLAEQVRTLLAAPPSHLAGTPLPRPMPEGLRALRRRRVPRLTLLRTHWRLAAALVVIAGAVGTWRLRPREVHHREFTVREVSSGGGNEATFRVMADTLRFFESPKGNVPIEQRQYATRFVEGVTRYVQVEMTLSYDPPGREVRFPFGCVIAREGAQVVTSLSLTATVQPTWRSSYHDAGFGEATPGAWDPGRYRVECRYNDRLLAREWFTIVAGELEPPKDAPAAQSEPLASLGARIAAIRFFESGYGRTPVDERMYATHFASRTARYINIEATLAYATSRERATARLTCRYLRDGETEVGRVELLYEIDSGETRRWSSGGLGANHAGTWAPGDYLVACDDGRATLAQVGFTVE